jgi:hypothetical protein
MPDIHDMAAFFVLLQSQNTPDQERGSQCECAQSETAGRYEPQTSESLPKEDKKGW